MREIARKTNKIDQIQRKIRKKQAQRDKTEKILRETRGEMVAACLVERRSLAGGKKRKTPAFYLSRKVNGKTVLKYIRKAELLEMKEKTARWKTFSAALAQWVKVTREIERLYREIGSMQSDQQNNDKKGS